MEEEKIGTEEHRFLGHGVENLRFL